MSKLTPDDFSRRDHHHDYVSGDTDNYMLKSDAYLTYVSRAYTAAKAADLSTLNSTIPAKLALITCYGLEDWVEASALVDWEYRWEHLNRGYGPIALTTAEHRSQSRLTADFISKLTAWALDPEGTPLTDEETYEITEYINQLIYFYAQGDLTGYTGTESIKYKSAFNNTVGDPDDEGVTIYASAGKATNVFNTETRAPLFTSRWDPHGLDLVVYRKYPSFVVADYYLKVPGNSRILTAWAFPGGKADSGMTPEGFMDPVYTGQDMLETNFVTRTHSGFGIRGIYDDTIVVRAMGKPFYVLAMVVDPTKSETFDMVPEWNDDPESLLNDEDETEVATPRYWLPCSFCVRRV